MLLDVFERSPLPPVMRFLITIMVACSVLAVEAAEADLPSFVPDVEAAEGLELRGQTWTHEDEMFTIYLRELDRQERLKYIEGATGLRIDPYAGPPDKLPRFLSFLLLIENQRASNPDTTRFVPLNRYQPISEQDTKGSDDAMQERY